MKCSGRSVAAASRVIEIDDVLVETMASGLRNGQAIRRRRRQPIAGMRRRRTKAGPWPSVIQGKRSSERNVTALHDTRNGPSRRHQGIIEARVNGGCQCLSVVPILGSR